MWLGVDPPERRKVCRRRTFNIKKPEAWLKSAGILEPLFCPLLKNYSLVISWFSIFDRKSDSETQQAKTIFRFLVIRR